MERERLPHITPKTSSNVLEALKGKTAGPYDYADGVSVRLAIEGGGLIGLLHSRENQEWATLFNHVLLTDRVAVFLAQELRKKGIDVNIRLITDTVKADHIARRQYEEARKYGNMFANKEIKFRTKDGAHALPLTEKLLRETNVSEEVVDLVKNSDVEYNDPYKVATTMEQKIFIYADLRATQKIISLKERFADLEARGRVENNDNLLRLKKWIYEIEKEIFSYLDFLPEDITDEYPSISLREGYLRRLYIQDAECSIFGDYSKWQFDVSTGEYAKKIKDNVPADTWWGQYVGNLFEAQGGRVLISKAGKKRGIDRAIEYYKSRESTK